MKRIPRVARAAVSDIETAEKMYCEGLRLGVLSSFRDHEGFDGIMVGSPEEEFHFEFSRSRRHPITPSPTPENPQGFYFPSETEWRLACDAMRAVRFRSVDSLSRYWSSRGCAYEDPEGYRVVLQQDARVSPPASKALPGSGVSNDDRSDRECRIP